MLLQRNVRFITFCALFPVLGIICPASARAFDGYCSCRCKPSKEVFCSETFGYSRTCWRALPNPCPCPPVESPANWSPPRKKATPPEPSRAGPTNDTLKGEEMLPQPQTEEPVKKPIPSKKEKTSEKQ
jgi:hypothetical protein